MNVRRAVSTFRGHHVPNVDFIGRKNIWFILSGFFIVLSIVGLAVRGLNFSIDFTGGSLLHFPNKSGASVGAYQSVMSRYVKGESQVEIVGGSDCPSGCVDIKTKTSLTELGLSQGSTPTPSPTTTVSPGASPSASA